MFVFQKFQILSPFYQEIVIDAIIARFLMANKEEQLWPRIRTIADMNRVLGFNIEQYFKSYFKTSISFQDRMDYLKLLFGALRAKKDIYQKYFDAYASLQNSETIQFFVSKINEEYETGIRAITNDEVILQKNMNILVGYKLKCPTNDPILHDLLPNLERYIAEDSILLLGPARHLNHSCKPNIKVSSTLALVRFTIIQNNEEAIGIGTELKFQYTKKFHPKDDPCTCMENLQRIN